MEPPSTHEEGLSEELQDLPYDPREREALFRKYPELRLAWSALYEGRDTRAVTWGGSSLDPSSKQTQDQGGISKVPEDEPEAETEPEAYAEPESKREQADRIARGHAYDKHVVERSEFPEISSRETFRDHILGVMERPSAERDDLNWGRKAYWDDHAGTLVLTDPKHEDGGTCFRPAADRPYYDALV